MTTPTPRSVFYTKSAWAWVGSDWLPIPVTNIIASMDRDRIPYVMATLECEWIDDAMFEALDPRRYDPGAADVTPVRWQLKQWAYDDEGDEYEVTRLPNVYIGNDEAVMHVRTITRDALNRTATIQLAGGEALMMDKRRMSGAGIDTGATTVNSLVIWSLTDVFGSYALTSAAIASATAIPAGERRYFNPGESHIDLLQPELDAIDCRLIGLWREDAWEIIVRDDDSGTMKLGSYTGGPGDVDPIIFGYTETATRDGDWADAVMFRFDTTDTGGSVVFQRSGTGANSRGRTFDRNRQGAPNTADATAARTNVRGYEVDVDARIRFDIDAYMTLEAYLPDNVRTVRVRGIEWDVEAGVMRIRAEVGEPVA